MPKTSADCNLTDAQKWTIYHLMQGGMERRAEIQHLMGISLKGVPLTRIFVELDNIQAEPRELAKQCWCGNCGEQIKIVPCQSCKRDRKPSSYRIVERRTHERCLDTIPDAALIGGEMGERLLAKVAV